VHSPDRIPRERDFVKTLGPKYGNVCLLSSLSVLHIATAFYRSRLHASFAQVQKELSHF
jgi:hypothetical protein